VILYAQRTPRHSPLRQDRPLLGLNTPRKLPSTSRQPRSAQTLTASDSGRWMGVKHELHR